MVDWMISSSDSADRATAANTDVIVIKIRVRIWIFIDIGVFEIEVYSHSIVPGGLELIS